jgi:hypothetical protein
MQTGQPGPITTFKLSGNKDRTPNRVIDASCVPQTCIILIS